ncbi:transaldolase [Leptolyngbya sp. FACHB-16]|uniref:transaldolase n=1 Tax=unclassified Leptolyngbya TaxID=2650499 RepID=UPI00168795AF|nr:transaldolase [Leptolyngbya sp. FACHB-16]MBD2153692.1 transaldolase [Leptolyngbya sp. FACHB-16]
MTDNRLQQLAQCGQSLWLDFLSRQILDSGELQQMIEHQNIRGLTSNPTIFEKAIAGSDLYRPDIERGAQNNLSTEQIYQSLAFDDIRRACDILQPIYQESDGNDGYVSMEVSPLLARDPQGTLQEARRFFQEINRENLMIKIPGTPESMEAVEQAIFEGMNVNITLLFSVDLYAESAWAYIRGLERRVEAGQPVNKLASVASFFLSRIDTKVDETLDRRINHQGTESLSEERRLQSVKGKVAIANAKLAYQRYLEIEQSDRWKALAAKGANPQRLLWASTGTKNPQYSDVRYVEELIGRNTVNTAPLDTIQACESHCDIHCDRITDGIEEAKNLINSLSDPDIDINLDDVMNELLEDGIEKFVQPYNSLLQTIDEQVRQLAHA